MKLKKIVKYGCPECGSEDVWETKELGIKSRFRYKCNDCESEFNELSKISEL